MAEKFVVPIHGNDHCPGGPDPIPCIRPLIPDIILSGGATTAPTNTTMPIPFFDVGYPSTTVIGSHFSLAITDDGDTGTDRYVVTSVREGWYAAELLTQWDQTTTGGTDEFGYAIQRLTWAPNTGFGFSPTEYKDAADWFDSDVHPLFEFVENSYLRTWIGPHYVPANRAWVATAKQRTGVDRGLSGIFLKIWFIASDNLSTWTFDTV